MDFLIFQKLNSFVGQSVCLDSIFIFFAQDLGYILAVVLFLFLLKNFKKYWLIAASAFMAAVFARFGIVELIRFFWERPRPFIDNNVNLLLEYEATFSFPSGHAAFFFALSTVVFLYHKKIYPLPKFWWGAGLLFFLASFLISVSRVVIGLHWPSDIIAGALVGIASGWLIVRVFKKT